MANSGMTHLPQLKSIRSDIVELGLLLLLDCLLHFTPYFIVLNFDGKNLVGGRMDYPAEKCDNSRHGDERSC